MAKMVEVNKKYKTVDKKIKPIAIPLPKDSWQRMKEGARDPSLRDSRGIRYTFIKETREKLRVGKDEFLLPEEEVTFWEMLERHAKAFAFYPKDLVIPNDSQSTIYHIF